jgi:hypothetical protein
MRRTNQSHKRNPREENDTRIYPEVHLLPGKLLPVVAIHPLVGSRANRLSRVEPSAGAAQPHIRWGSFKPRAPLEYPIHELPQGRIKNPVRAPTIFNCKLNHLRCSKPSDWSLESSPHDRTRPVARDRTCRASDQLLATLCSFGLPTGRTGSIRDRTRRLRAFLCAQVN